MRNLKSITHGAGGKADGFVPLKVAAKSPGMTEAGRRLLSEREAQASAGKGEIRDGDAAAEPLLTLEQIALLAHTRKKHACHSENVADANEAKRVQREIVTIGETRTG